MKRRLEINKLKTGMLMSYCCHCTAIAAGKNVKYQNKIKKLGMFIGEIFQINDDFEDFPKMKISDKKIYNEYKKKLYQKSYIIMKDLKFRKKENLSIIRFCF